MYHYNINKTKLVIIPLDGTVFDLNRYRYNYYHHLCDNKHIPLDKNEFYSQLSNMYDMYKHLPLAERVDSGPLNAKIERELAQYLSHKGIKPKEGFVELVEYLHQKGIKVAIMSTHRTKDAVFYLQQAKLYNKVQFIIGSDTSSLPLPSTQILETVAHYFKVSHEETLVISSFMSLNNAAKELQMGLIYCEDLVKAGSNETESCYKSVSHLFEVLNIFLFDKYEDAGIYSPILGMNNTMNKQQLDNIHTKLKDTYKDDSQVISLVDQTYQYHISQLSDQEINNEKQTIKKRQFTFDDIGIAEDKHIISNDIKETIEKPEDTNQEKSEIHLNTLINKDQEELTALLQQINKKQPQESTVKKVTDYDEIKQIVKESLPEEEQHFSFINFLFNVFYVFAVSFLILFSGILIYIAFIQQFEAREGIFATITSIYQGYYSIIENIFSVLLNGLHSLMSFIPSYQQYETANILFSVDGVHLFNVFLFQSLLIAIIKIIIFIFRKGLKDENSS